MGINWAGIVFGLGAVIAMGYWTTDFLVVQRVLSAKDLRSAELAPIIGAAFKMCVPFIVILPGLLGLALLRDPGGHLLRLVPADVAWSPAGQAQGLHGYDEVLPLMLARYCGPGLLGLGITALIAGFMSGMAGNVSAFTTVWTYDIYATFIKKDASDEAKVSMGRWVTVIGVIISIGTAYLVMQARRSWTTSRRSSASSSRRSSVPLFSACFGSARPQPAVGPAFWPEHCRRSACTPGSRSTRAVRYVALSPQAQDQAQNMFRALWCWLICVIVTVVVSLHDQAEAGFRTRRIRLWADADSKNTTRQLDPKSVILGSRGRNCFCHFADYLLVGGTNEIRRITLDLVFYWRLLGVNGLLIFATGIYETIHPPADKVVLYNLHANVWWGAVLLVLGLFFSLRFSPARERARMSGNS